MYCMVVTDDDDDDWFRDWITLKEAKQLAVVWAKEISQSKLKKYGFNGNRYHDIPAKCSIYRLNSKGEMSILPILEYKYDARTKKGTWFKGYPATWDD